MIFFERHQKIPRKRGKPSWPLRLHLSTRRPSIVCEIGLLILNKLSGSLGQKGVPLKYTLAAIAKQLDGDKAVLFPNPDHHPISVVSGIVSKRDWIAEAMGVSNNMLLEHFREAVLNPIPWKEIKKAPAQEIVIRKNIDINSILQFQLIMNMIAGRI